MQILFALYREYERAQAAVDDLLEEEIEEGQLNTVARDEVRDAHGLTLRALQAESARRPPEAARPTLGRILAAQQPLEVPELGAIVAAGDVATIAAPTAAAPGAVERGLAGVLTELGLPTAHAQNVIAGLGEGGLLLWIRVSDERASAIAHRLRGAGEAEDATVYAV